MMLLGAALQRFTPAGDAPGEGGSMANPSKAVSTSSRHVIDANPAGICDEEAPQYVVAAIHGGQGGALVYLSGVDCIYPANAQENRGLQDRQAATGD